MSQEMKSMIMSRIPAKTWYWLNVNEARADVPEQKNGNAPVTRAQTDAGSQIFTYTFAKGRSDASLNYLCPAGQTQIVIQNLNTDFFPASGSKAQAEPSGSLESYGLIDSNIQVHSEGCLMLIQVFRGSSDSLIRSRIHAVCAESAHFHLIQLVISGRQNYIDLTAELLGQKSRFDADFSYIADQDHVVDVNYYVPQEGRRTSSRITVSGILKDKAQKTFRGTIDFRKGSAGSVGAEKEDVLLINEGVKNVTVPVILCSEEDVDGTHGASIGKIDPSVLFYLMTRGFSEQKVYTMLAAARLSAAVRQIPDEQIRSSLQQELEGVTL